MKSIDKKLKDIITNDDLPFTPSPAIQQRLNYQLQLKSVASEVKQNSIISVIVGLFTSKLFGLKISILSIAFFAFFGYQQVNTPSAAFPVLDTAYVSKPIDTANLIIPGDTSFLIDLAL